MMMLIMVCPHLSILKPIYVCSLNIVVTYPFILPYEEQEFDLRSSRCPMSIPICHLDVLMPNPLLDMINALDSCHTDMSNGVGLGHFYD